MAFAVGGQLARGSLAQEPRPNLGPALASSYWQFTLTGTATAATVYQDANLTTPFPTNQVASDSQGRFPAIYLDSSVVYRAQLFNSNGVSVRGPYDNYQSPLPTSGSSQTQTVGFKITPFNEFTAANAAGGTGNALTLNATEPSGACVRFYGTVPGANALEVDSSATTGAQTATFTATNKPGIATSAPVAWLPIKCDGQIYYTPLWRGDTFVPIIPVTQQVLGQMISCASVTFNGDGTTTLTGTGASATPSSWYTPPVSGIGSGYWINVTKTGGTGTFSGITPGVWTNIGAGGLQIGSTPGGGPVSGTYQLSTSNTGSPVVANGTISCTFAPVLRIYTSGSGVETTPIGATTMIVENWAGGGPGGGGAGSLSLDTAHGGGGGEGGGYCRSSYNISAQPGVTLNWSVGAGGVSPSVGGSSSVTAGTITGFTAMNATGGNPGGNATTGLNGQGGTGGANASGGNQVNDEGQNGSNGMTNSSGGLGAPGWNGTVPGDGSPYGAGGKGGDQGGQTGLSGQGGAVVFYYT